MSQQLISLNDDLRRLRDEGYEVEIRSSHLLVHSVPYVTSACTIAYGSLVSELSMAGADRTSAPGTHVAHFIGGPPRKADGSEISGIMLSHQRTQLAPDLWIDCSFSNRPAGGAYPDYYQKMTRYIEIISFQAKAIDNTVDARTYKLNESSEPDSVFRYLDTASSRAGIMALNARLASQKVAIVGLGGTGAYILDFIAKTPVRELHLFDADEFHQHNAFRSPGAAGNDVWKDGSPTKVDHLADVYGQMRRGIFAHAERIHEENVGVLLDFDFVFICVDKGSPRKLIVEALAKAGRHFVDVGMGVQLDAQQQQLWGVCRVTTGAPGDGSYLGKRIPMGDNDGNDVYGQNIQIVELNALTAVMAVVRWKKLLGFYSDDRRERNSTYSTNFNMLSSDEVPE